MSNIPAQKAFLRLKEDLDLYDMIGLISILSEFIESEVNKKSKEKK